MSNEYDNHSHDELVAVIRGLTTSLKSAEAALAAAEEKIECLGGGVRTISTEESAVLAEGGRDILMVARLVLRERTALAAAREENEMLRDAAAFYLRERPCFGIGSRMGCCADSVNNRPAKRCVHLSDDPEEYCFSGKFMEALGIVGEDAAEKLSRLRLSVAADAEEVRTLREERDALQTRANVQAVAIEQVEKERDSARRELCLEVVRVYLGTAAEYAAARGWSYLYEEKPKD